MDTLSLVDTRTDLTVEDTNLVYPVGVVPTAVVRARRRPCDECGKRRVLYNVRRGSRIAGPWRCKPCAGL